MRIGLLLAGTALVASCSGPVGAAADEHVVFTVAAGFSQSGPATTIDVIDLGLPLLHNASGHPVRLRSVSLVTPAEAVHVLSVVAYRYSQIHGGWGLDAATCSSSAGSRTQLPGSRRLSPDRMPILPGTWSSPS